MTEQQYERLTQPFRSNLGAAKVLLIVNKALTVLGYVAYPLLLVLVALSGAWIDLLKFILVPGVAFFALSAFRKWHNAPRPYEVLDIKPLIAKDTQGKSFPSRHSFSLMMIACTWFAWNAPVGIFLIVCSALIAVIRVVGGVHFPKDVVAAVLFAIFCAIVGYGIIPW